MMAKNKKAKNNCKMIYCPTLGVWIQLQDADRTSCDAARSTRAIQDDNERI